MSSAISRLDVAAATGTGVIISNALAAAAASAGPDVGGQYWASNEDRLVVVGEAEAEAEAGNGSDYEWGVTSIAVPNAGSDGDVGAWTPSDDNCIP